MKEIIEKANELGLLIQKTEIYKKFHELNQKVEENKESSDLLKSYSVLADDISNREKNEFSVEKYEKEELNELSIEISKNKLLVDFLSSRDKYIMLLNDIQKSITG